MVALVVHDADDLDGRQDIFLISAPHLSAHKPRPVVEKPVTLVGTRRPLHLDKDGPPRRTAQEVEQYPPVIPRLFRQLRVPELQRGYLLRKDVVQKPDQQVRVSLEQVLERPVTGQVKVLGSGEPLGVGVLLLAGHPGEPSVPLDQTEAAAVAPQVKLLLRQDGGVRGGLLVNGLLVNGSPGIGIQADGLVHL